MAHRSRRPRKLQVVRDYKGMTVRLSPDTFQQLEDVLDHTGMSQTAFIEYAIDMHHSVLGFAKPKPPVSPAQARKSLLRAASRLRDEDDDNY